MPVFAGNRTGVAADAARLIKIDSQLCHAIAPLKSRGEFIIRDLVALIKNVI
jgi:hypothetical protein